MKQKWYQVSEKITNQKYPERRMPQNVFFQTKELKENHERKSGFCEREK